jgi:hypothetical protein
MNYEENAVLLMVTVLLRFPWFFLALLLATLVRAIPASLLWTMRSHLGLT